jgi:hypothetical protein
MLSIAPASCAVHGWTSRVRSTLVTSPPRSSTPRNQGEFFVLSAMLAQFHTLYGRFGRRFGGFTAAMLENEATPAFPRSVLPEERRKRTYWNGVLARAEESSSYQPARRLWRRERFGHYVPSATTSLRTIDDHGVEAFRPLADLLCIRMLDELGAAGRA